MTMGSSLLGCYLCLLISHGTVLIQADPNCESNLNDSDEQCVWDSPDDLKEKAERWMPPSLLSTDDPSCLDENLDDCEMRALRGDCAKQPERVLRRCPNMCALCNNHNLDEQTVRTCYGEVQEAHEKKTLDLIEKMQDYMINTVYVDPQYENVRAECKNRHTKCSYWAASGECEKNPKYNKLQCAPACQTCLHLDYNYRCPFNKKNAKDITVWTEPGSVNGYFRGLLAKPAYRDRVRVLSGPADVMKSDEDWPWVVTIDDFLSAAECKKLIQLGHDIGYKRSKDIGRKQFDGTFDSKTSKDRTSTTAWCSRNSKCNGDPVTVAVTKRIEELVEIPSNHSEYLQLLRYEVGQHYKTHHDYSASHKDRPQGVRILTVFLYLNDEGLKGGGTNFPLLNLTVVPKQGRAVVWPSVDDQLPSAEKDKRTEHQALPVEAGVKYGANAWIHERDFRTQMASGCT